MNIYDKYIENMTKALEDAQKQLNKPNIVIQTAISSVLENLDLSQYLDKVNKSVEKNYKPYLTRSFEMMIKSLDDMQKYLDSINWQQNISDNERDNILERIDIVFEVHIHEDFSPVAKEYNELKNNTSWKKSDVLALLAVIIDLLTLLTSIFTKPESTNQTTNINNYYNYYSLNDQETESLEGLDDSIQAALESIVGVIEDNIPSEDIE